MGQTWLFIQISGGGVRLGRVAPAGSDVREDPDAERADLSSKYNSRVVCQVLQLSSLIVKKRWSR
jgi:hypothetical protein